MEDSIRLSTSQGDLVKVIKNPSWIREKGTINLYISDNFEGYDINLNRKEALEVSKMLKEAAENA